MLMSYLSCQGTATFKSRDLELSISTQTLRSNDSITVLPEVVHNVRIFYLQLSAFLHMASNVFPRVLFWWWDIDRRQHTLFVHTIGMLPV